jgi:AcrR family transcriptional regulator
MTMNREEKKQQTRTKLIGASLEILEEFGYEAASVQQITERAGVSKGTFFNYFNSKDDLICELQGMMALEEIEKIKDKPGPYIPRFKSVLYELAQKQFPSRALNRALLQGTLGNPKSLEAQSRMLTELATGLVPIIKLSQDSGESRKDMPAEVITELAIQTYFGVMLMWSMDRGDERFVEQVAVTFEVFFRGIEAG